MTHLLCSHPICFTNIILHSTIFTQWTSPGSSLIHYIWWFSCLYLLLPHYSSVSSLLNSAALVILQDFVRPLRPNLTESQATIISKVLVFVLGAVDIALVLFARFFGAGLMSVSEDCGYEVPFLCLNGES